MVCSKCGAELPDCASFCTSCGARIKKNIPQAGQTQCLQPEPTRSLQQEQTQTLPQNSPQAFGDGRTQILQPEQVPVQAAAPSVQISARERQKKSRLQDKKVLTLIVIIICSAIEIFFGLQIVLFFVSSKTYLEISVVYQAAYVLTALIAEFYILYLLRIFMGEEDTKGGQNTFFSGPRPAGKQEVSGK